MQRKKIKKSLIFIISICIIIVGIIPLFSINIYGANLSKTYYYDFYNNKVHFSSITVNGTTNDNNKFTSVTSIYYDNTLVYNGSWLNSYTIYLRSSPTFDPVELNNDLNGILTFSVYLYSPYYIFYSDQRYTSNRFIFSFYNLDAIEFKGTTYNFNGFVQINVIGTYLKSGFYGCRLEVKYKSNTILSQDISTSNGDYPILYFNNNTYFNFSPAGSTTNTGSTYHLDQISSTYNHYCKDYFKNYELLYVFLRYKYGSSDYPATCYLEFYNNDSLVDIDFSKSYDIDFYNNNILFDSLEILGASSTGSVPFTAIDQIYYGDVLVYSNGSWTTGYSSTLLYNQTMTEVDVTTLNSDCNNIVTFTSQSYILTDYLELTYSLGSFYNNGYEFNQIQIYGYVPYNQLTPFVTISSIYYVNTTTLQSVIVYQNHTWTLGYSSNLQYNQLMNPPDIVDLNNDCIGIVTFTTSQYTLTEYAERSFNIDFVNNNTLYHTIKVCGQIVVNGSIYLSISDVYYDSVVAYHNNIWSSGYSSTLLYNQTMQTPNVYELNTVCNNVITFTVNGYVLYVEEEKTFDVPDYNNGGSDIYDSITITITKPADSVNDSIIITPGATEVNEIKYGNTVVYDDLNGWDPDFDNELQYYLFENLDVDQLNDYMNNLVQLEAIQTSTVSPNLHSDLLGGVGVMMLPVQTIVHMAESNFVIAIILMMLVVSFTISIVFIFIKRK